MRIEFFSQPPSSSLQPFVECYWGVRGTGAFDREVILPNGFTELMVNFGPTQRVHAYGDRQVDEAFHRAWLAGIQDTPLTIGSPDGCDHIAVRFRPGGAHALFNLPMHDIAGRVLDLDLLLGPQARALRDRLGAIGDGRERIEALEAWLIERLRSVHPYFTTICRAMEMVRASGFSMSVTAICERLGLSNRHLIAQFRRVVGLTPKTMARIDRFHAVIEATKGRADVDWAGLAYRFHYADQSHLVREFKRLSGVSPGRFLARRAPGEETLVGDGR